MNKEELLGHDKLIMQEPDLKRLHDAYEILSSNRAEGISELEDLVGAGSVIAMLYLGFAYTQKENFNQAKAENWYRAAREKGSLEGLRYLAKMYIRQRRYEEAEDLLNCGISNDDAVSMRLMAVIYLKDRRYSRLDCSSETRRLLNISASRGYVQSRKALAYLLIRGRFGIAGVLRGIIMYIHLFFLTVRIAARNPNDDRLS